MDFFITISFPHFGHATPIFSKYGFVLRFADGTSKITGITQEPWHFRYVGKKAAKIMYENNWTLEEYCLYTGDLPALKS